MITWSAPATARRLATSLYGSLRIAEYGRRDGCGSGCSLIGKT